MTCTRCGRLDCDSTCSPAPAPSKDEPQRKGRLGPSDTLPDIEDEEDEEELFDADDGDEVTQA
jgi:hypothetical protein